jgi:hypothetical protein
METGYSGPSDEAVSDETAGGRSVSGETVSRKQNLREDEGMKPMRRQRDAETRMNTGPK